MDLTVMKANAALLHKEMQWLGQLIDTRMKLYWGQACTFNSIDEVVPPALDTSTALYAQIVQHYRLGRDERIILLLALAPHLLPHLLDVFFVKNSDYDRGFTEFGGIKGQQHGGFLPTGETAAFILAANDLEKRFALLDIFSEEHTFCKYNMLKLVPSQQEEPFLSGIISLSAEYLSYFTRGVTHQPDFNMNFPAKHLKTSLDWSHLVLEENTMQEVLEIRDWLQYGNTLMNDWGMHDKIKPGFRALFYGPPGTGKTLTATLLARSTRREVYRIDLSMVVSKYIGETEKNLSGVFDQAARKDWILFFDEADALFGKRTQTSSAHDRYANQEVSYLLQRMEDFPGVVILATNLKANLDDAFSRRFQSMILFDTPGPEQRLLLWKQSFSEKSVLEEGLNLEEVAAQYEMTGGAIINVTRYCSLMAIKRGTTTILQKDLLTGIRKEFGKEGKTVN